MRNRNNYLSTAVTAMLVLFIGIAGVFRGRRRTTSSTPAVEMAFDIRRKEHEQDVLEFGQEDEASRSGGGIRSDAAALGNRGPPYVSSFGHGARITTATIGTRTTSPGGIVDNARAAYRQISTVILSRWGTEYENTLLFSGEGMRFSDEGRVVENKMLNAVLEQGDFLAAFTGISTTAGHDCLYEESYPIVFNATMSRLMAASGVRFEAINAAMGNTRIAPYSYCVDAHAGLDADIISWDMSMEAASHECGRAAASMELFIRSATVLPRHPAVLIMDASPETKSCESPNRKSALLRRSYQLLTGGCDPNRSLMKVYRDFGLHQLAPSVLIPTVACGDDRFSHDRLYNSTEKVYPRPASWHPAPAGHLLLADMLFMNYGKAFLRALDRLEEVAPGVTSADLRAKDGPSRTALGASLGLGSEALREDRREEDGVRNGGKNMASGHDMGSGRGDILPPPAWCGGWHFCDFAGDYRCANTLFPLAGKKGFRLLDMVSKRSPAVLNLDRTKYVVQPTKGHWAVTINEDKMPIIEYLSASAPKGKHKPIDKKWVLVGNRLSGPIEFEFETIGSPQEEGATAAKEKGDIARGNSRVGVCRPGFIKRVDFADPAGVKFRVDGVEGSVMPLQHKGLPDGSCVLLDMDVGVGKHNITVEPLRDGKPYVAISHVLYPA